ncbi:MAG TPA: HAD-IA family hydrolase [Caldimonas sp.]
MHPIRAVLFDLDGTLADTAGEIALALERTFAGLGLPALPDAEVRALIGRGIASLVERALQRLGATVDAADAIERFEAAYAQTVGTSALLYPTVGEGLARLAAAGVPLGVVTNKSRAFTLRLLDRLAVEHRFAAVVAGDDGWPRKPAADMMLGACAKLATAPAATLMLGDSANDVLAARAAGCPVWCVPYGYNEGRPVETLGADRIVADVAEAVDRLLGVNPVDRST